MIANTLFFLIVGAVMFWIGYQTAKQKYDK